MKIFVPMSDALLSEHGELSGTLVPFTPDLLLNRPEGEKRQEPACWISTSERRKVEPRMSSTSTSS
ncbi:MAG: hypothetical protein JKY88_07100 [Pseudomonadales bacterium]|nr:hypothetical protein [Pseudomonadales bacterium]